jgi:hypothetical protein
MFTRTFWGKNFSRFVPCNIIFTVIFLFEEILSLSFLARRKEDNRKDVFVKVGQSLKLENTGTRGQHL